MTESQRYSVAAEAARRVATDRKLRRKFGIGWVSILSVILPILVELTPEFIALVQRIIRLIEDREREAGLNPGMGRFEAYQQVSRRHDAELLDIVRDAELEVVGP